MIRKKGIAFRLTFVILASCTIIFGAIFSYNYAVSRRIIIQDIRALARNLTLVTVNKTESVLLPIERVPQNLAYFLEESPCDKERLINLLRVVVQNNPEIYGSAVAFEPYAFDKNAMFFAPYFCKSTDGVKLTYLGADYKYFNWDWYQIPKELNQPLWSEPYYDEGGGNIIMTTYSVPFYQTTDGKKQFMGVITADVSLGWLQDIVSSIKIGETGYGFLISKNGRIVTHPVKELIMNGTIFDLAESKGDPVLREIGKKMIRGESGFAPSKSILTGEKCWIAYAPLPSSGWSLGVVFPQNELMADIGVLNRIVGAGGCIGFVILLVVIVFISASITRPLRMLNETTKDIARGNLEFKLEPIKSGDEVAELADAFIYMRGALKKYIAELTAATVSRERIESELRIAHDIQQNIVPRVFPAFSGRKEFDLYAALEPAKEVGGDFYDFFFIDDGRLCLVIGDVVGKGVPGALFMAMTKTLIKATAKQCSSPEEILEKTNKEISSDNSSCMFITIFLAILDTASGEVSYCNAGHNMPFILREGKEPEPLAAGRSMAIGIEENSVFTKGKVIMRTGDTLCLYTDGVTEAFNKLDEQFSDDRLINVLAHRQKDSVELLIKALLGEIKLFAQGVEQSDDITLLAIKYLKG